MEKSPSPISIPQKSTLQDPGEAFPKPYKKSLVTTLMEATTLRSPSFREDTYLVSHLKSTEKKALQELKDKLATTHGGEGDGSGPSMWGIPLIDGDDKADIILLKFL